MSSRIIGADWASRYPRWYGTPRPRALPAPAGEQRLPCPICGHPTGDCNHQTEELAMAKPKKDTAAKETTTATDPVTGTPTAPSDADGTNPAPDTGDGDGDSAAQNAADGSTGTPIAPDGTVNTDMGYEPVGDTGAKNADDMLAGGMPEASEALSAELADVDEPTIRRRAFTSHDNGTVTATRTVFVDFVPNHAKRTSTIKLFVKGQTYPERDVARRLAEYDDRNQAKVHYGD